MRKLFFNEYTDLNQEKFADMNDPFGILSAICEGGRTVCLV